MTDEQARLTEAAIAAPFTFELGGRVFVLPRPEPADWFTFRGEMRRQLLAEQRDPLTVVNEAVLAAEKAKTPLHPAVVEIMVRNAQAAIGARQKKVEPAEEQIRARANDAAGLRWWLWHLIRKVDDTVSQEWVAAAVPDEDAAEVSSRLVDALDPASAPEKKLALLAG